MSYQPLTYYIDNAQIRKLMEFSGDRLETLAHDSLWDLITIISAELSVADPKQGDCGLVRMETTSNYLHLALCRSTEIAMEILDGISRRDAKLLLMGMTAIAAYSDIH